MAVRQLLVRNFPSGYTSNNLGTTGYAALSSSSIGFSGGFTAVQFLGQTQPWSVAGTFRNLSVKLASAPGNSVTYTLRKNGVDTALTVTITSPATTGSDTTHTVAVSAGDRFTLKAVVGSTSATATAAMLMHLEFASTNVGESGYSASDLNSTWSSGTDYLLPIGDASTGSNIAAAGLDSFGNGFPILVPGNITRYDVLSTNGVGVTGPGTGNFTFTVMKNAVAQDGSGGTPDTRVSITGATTTVSWTGTLPVVAGDRLMLRCHATTNGAAFQMFPTSFCLTASVDGRFQTGVPLSFQSGDTAPAYEYGGHVPGETIWRSVEPVAPNLLFDVWCYQLYLLFNPLWAVSGTHISYGLRIDGATPSPTVALNTQDVYISSLHASVWAAFSSVTGEANAVEIATGHRMALLAQSTPFALPGPTQTLVAPAEGPIAGGTTVIITGTNFVATPTITFNGVAATDVVWLSATSLQCVTPAHVSGPTQIIVTNPDGQMCTLNLSYQYLPNPASFPPFQTVGQWSLQRFDFQPRREGPAGGST